MIAYARHQVELNRVEGDRPMRDWWQASAKTGNVEAIEALRERPFPEPIAYLWRWLLEIRRGLGMDGLTWQAIGWWARFTKHRPQPHEVDALFAIDAAMRETIEPEQAKAANDDATSYDVAVERKSKWPAKKPAPEPTS